MSRWRLNEFTWPSENTRRPSEYVYRFADFEIRIKFPVCKLIEKLETQWKRRHNLPVELARAQIAALRTADDAQGRYDAKWQLVRNLYLNFRSFS